MQTEVSETHSNPSSTLISPQQFYEHFGGTVGRTAVYELVRAGKIRHIKLGKQKILILASELTEWPIRAAQEAETVQYD